MTYGLSRDFTASFNAPGYSPFSSKAAPDENTLEKQQRVAAKNLAHRKKISFQEAMVIVKAPDFAGNAIKKKATRVNPEMHLCTPGGEAVQKKEIRSILSKTKAASAID